MYEYRAQLIRVIDGDTLEASIDLGFDTWVKKTLRLKGIDAPETRTKDDNEKARGLQAKAFLLDIMHRCDGQFIVHSLELDKFGRVLADLFIDGHMESVNFMLLNAGLAVEYQGGAR
jgi:micrococcal nuclease